MKHTAIAHIRVIAYLRWIAPLLLISLLGCGGSTPTAPTPNTTAPLHAGSYRLDVTGFGISLDPSVPVCENPFLIGGTKINTFVELTRQSNQWVARSRADTAGDIRIVFAETRSDITAVYLSGTGSGSAVDLATRPLDSATGVRMSIGASPGESVQLDGDMAWGHSEAGGYLNGRITFTDIDGRVSTCNRVSWYLFPV